MARRIHIAIAALLAVSAVQAETLTYTDIIGQLTDLDRLTRYEEGVTAGQCSSWHRDELVRWATNADAGNFLRIEPDGEGVMMDEDGPGCIFRLWSANPQGKLRVYLDGAEEPTFEWDFASLFLGETHPFIQPLVWKRSPEAMTASDCYVPIPFAKHVKVTCTEPGGRFYQVGYLRYPTDWQVESFHLPLTPGEDSALRAAADAWAHPSTDPKPKLPGQATVTTEMTLAAGQTIALADLNGPGVVRALRARVTSEQRDFWRKLVLSGTWDGAQAPQVLSPLGPFLGFDWVTADYGSLIAGCRDGECWFHYPMPFRESGQLTLTSHLSQPAAIHVEVDWAPLGEVSDDLLYFNARWRHEPDSESLDYPFIETAGRGHLVGITLQVDHPIPGWWGEGDEKVWIDDDTFPRWVGTGSEDYFGDAWGIRYLPGPSWGCSVDPDISKAARTCPYRWHFMDRIPFAKRLRMTIENYGCWGTLWADEFEYNSVAYWYQAELTPPFADLAGAKYVGGDEYLQTPAEYSYHTDLFPRTLSADDLRTTGLDVPFALEAEDLMRAAVADGDATLVDDGALPYQFNAERAVDFGTVEAGAQLADLDLPALAAGVYFPVMLTAPEATEVTLEWNGRRLGIEGRAGNDAYDLAGVLVEGEAAPQVALLAEQAGHAVVDAIVLRPAPQEEGAMEAEACEVTATTGGAEMPHPSPPMRGPSAGQVLEFDGTGPGQGMVLRIPRDADRGYVLGMRPMLGPAAGVIQAFCDGKPIGPGFDLYAPEERLSAAILPLGPLPAEAGQIELRVVGRNGASAGYQARLDTFRWEPLIIHPDSTAGVWAIVLGTDRCAYSIQDLGPRFVGGHHLWVNPSDRDAWVDIGITVPDEGGYAIEARYTTSWDYAIAQASLDGQPIGERVDLYTPTVEQTEPMSYGTVHLTAGRHVFRLQAADRNAESAGYLMGIDYIRVTKRG